MYVAGGFGAGAPKPEGGAPLNSFQRGGSCAPEDGRRMLTEAKRRTMVPALSSEKPRFGAMSYFNSLSFREALMQLGVCRFMDKSEFSDGVDALRGKKIVIVGAGAQGVNQGLNLRDSGLDVSYALRKEAIAEKRASFKNATEQGFKVGTYEELIPTADVVGNLTPDKQHTAVVSALIPLMKKGASLWYSHGFNIVEEGMQVRK